MIVVILLSFLQVDSLLERKPSQLSGGQRQRVAIGRALVREPRIFLFDEPLSNLDAELRVQMRLEIARLHKELSATIIYVTHDQVEAMTLADRIVVLRDGIVEQSGKPTDLYQKPKNIFVAGFIGSPKMNFVKCKLIKVNQGVAEIISEQLTNNILHVKINEVNSKELIPQSEFTMGFRPENIVLDQKGPINCKVIVVERLGNISYLYAEIKGGGTITLEQPKLTNIKPKETIAFFPDPDYLYLFNTNGKRL